jgi:sodium-coupled neutral amino acid transporter 7/8
MCYFQRLDFLKYAGTLGVFSMLYVVFLNVYQFFVLELDPIKTAPSTAGNSALGLVAVIPVICFAYQCHEIVVPVYACMDEKDRNMKSFGKTTALTLGLLFALYCTAGTFGYLTFGSSVSPDIMQGYDANDPLVVIGIIALVIKMITTYPPMIVCGRGALDGLYAEYFQIPTEQFIAGESKRRFVITTVWFFTSLGIAIFTPNIGVVIEILGSLASVNVFIFPSLCLMAIAKRRQDQLSKFTRYVFNGFAVSLIVMGVVMFGIVMMQVVEDIKGSGNIPHEVLCKPNNNLTGF